MRVISGIRKGHRLKTLKGDQVRPTEDRVKESLFNILTPINQDAVVLDLFSGSGAIGIEFLSRGVKRAYMVDVSKASIDVIKDNLKATRLEENAVVLHKDSISAIKYFGSTGIKFQYIFIDPPFKDHELLYNSIKCINEHKLLESKGLIIIEHERELKIEEEFSGFSLCDKRDYGKKTISFYKYNEV